MWVVALDEELRRALFSAEEWARLEGLVDVAVVGSQFDVTEPGVSGVLAQATGLITGWGCPELTASVLEACPRLEVIVHTGGSVRAFVGDAVFSRGIVVASQTELNAEPVAQFCLAQILLAAKGVGRATRAYAALRGGFDAFAASAGVGVYGATVGLIGYGRVCHRLIELLRGFGLRVLVSTPYLDGTQAAEVGVEVVDTASLMRTADVISVHLGDTPDNHGAITAELLALIKPGATFLNTARGIVVDEAALVRELQTGRFDAVLDVTWPEVPGVESPLWTLPNVTLTPHWAGSLGRELRRLGEGTVDNVAQWVAGVPLTGRVDPALAAYIA